MLKPLDTCLNPVIVKTPDGDRTIVNCGHCSVCLSHKQNVWRSRLQFELQDPNVFAAFVTLTYSNDHMPLAHYDELGRLLYTSRTKFLTNGEFIRVKYQPWTQDPEILDGDEIEPYESDIDFSAAPHFVLSCVNDVRIFDTSNTFGICSLPDIQDFFKRLRINLSRDPSLCGFDTSVRYFLCSEYGPKTYRPHYHAILFFNSSKVRESALQSHILESWNKCKLDDHQREESLKVITSNSVASYVSKYVTCFSNLPVVFTHSFFRTFYTFSKKKPIGSNPISLHTAAVKVQTSDIIYHSSYFDKDEHKFISIDAPYSCSFWNRIYPKFYKHGSLSTDFLRQIFRRLYELAVSECELPNYVNYVTKCFDIRNQFNPFGEFTLSQRFDDILNSTYGLDYFLFGIPFNRAASRKIYYFIRDHLLFSSNRIYCSLDEYFNAYQRYFSIVFRDSFTRFADYSNYLTTVLTPSLVLHLYPSLFLSLPSKFTDLDEESYNYFKDLIWSNFNLELEFFYNSDLSKISPYIETKLTFDYLFNVYNKSNKFKNKRLFNYKKFNDL